MKVRLYEKGKGLVYLILEDGRVLYMLFNSTDIVFRIYQMRLQEIEGISKSNVSSMLTLHGNAEYRQFMTGVKNDEEYRKMMFVALDIMIPNQSVGVEFDDSLFSNLF